MSWTYSEQNIVQEPAANDGSRRVDERVGV